MPYSLSAPLDLESRAATVLRAYPEAVLLYALAKAIEDTVTPEDPTP